MSITQPNNKVKTILAAIAFSPRCKEMLAEAKYYSNLFDAKLYILHVGEKTEYAASTLTDYCNELSIKNYELIFKSGSVSDTLIDTANESNIDLLILGALPKENIVNFYLGSTARSVGRNAKCSVLLITNPKSSPKPIQKIIVNHSESDDNDGVDMAVFIAQRQIRTDIFLVNEIHQPALAYTMADGSSSTESKSIKSELVEDEIAELKELCDKHACETIRMISKSINGKPGYAVSSFAKLKKADLLIVNAPEKKLGLLDRIFLHDIEFIFADMPCNVLLVAPSS